MYVPTLLAQRAALDYGALSAATLSAFAGAVIGNRYLRKVTLESIHRLVAVLLGIVAVALRATRAASPPPVTMTSTFSRTSSAASSERRSARAFAQRASKATLWPSTYPSSWSA